MKMWAIGTISIAFSIYLFDSHSNSADTLLRMGLVVQRVMAHKKDVLGATLCSGVIFAISQCSAETSNFIIIVVHYNSEGLLGAIWWGIHKHIAAHSSFDKLNHCIKKVNNVKSRSVIWGYEATWVTFFEK